MFLVLKRTTSIVVMQGYTRNVQIDLDFFFPPFSLLFFGIVLLLLLLMLLLLLLYDCWAKSSHVTLSMKERIQYRVKTPATPTHASPWGIDSS
jgi:hypothetical protein